MEIQARETNSNIEQWQVLNERFAPFTISSKALSKRQTTILLKFLAAQCKPKHNLYCRIPLVSTIFLVLLSIYK